MPYSAEGIGICVLLQRSHFVFLILPPHPVIMLSALCPAWRHPCVDTDAVKGQLGVESRRVSADTLGTEQCSEAETVAEDRAVQGYDGVQDRSKAAGMQCSAYAGA